MPLEIRELVIRVTVDESTRKKELDAKDLQDLKNKVVRECIEKVLAKLETISER